MPKNYYLNNKNVYPYLNLNNLNNKLIKAQLKSNNNFEI